MAGVVFLTIIATAPAAAGAPAGRGPYECTEWLYRNHRCEPMRPANWTGVEANDGQMAYVDTASVRHRRDLVPPFTDENGRVGRVARALVFFDDGMPIGAENAGWYDVDCDGPHLIGRAGTWPPAPAQFLPPKSIGYEIRSIACGFGGDR
jgi:hypothetical protein